MNTAAHTLNLLHTGIITRLSGLQLQRATKLEKRLALCLPRALPPALTATNPCMAWQQQVF